MWTTRSCGRRRKIRKREVLVVEGKEGRTEAEVGVRVEVVVEVEVGVPSGAMGSEKRISRWSEFDGEQY